MVYGYYHITLLLVHVSANPPDEKHYHKVSVSLSLTKHRICTSALYTMTYGQITVEFNCSRLTATLGLSLFILGLGVGPLFLAPLSEVSPRFPVLLIT